MTRSKRPSGRCHLCGLFVEKLSYEHVPPEKAYNDSRVVRADMQMYINDRHQMFKHGEVLQRGAGAFTLCEPCNNSTGSWYAGEYIAWAKEALELLTRLPPDGEYVVSIRRRRPLRFLKQVAAMFFSVNGPDFASRHPELQRFVLNKEAKGLPERYQFYLTLVRGGYSRSSGMSGMASISNGSTRLVSEIVHVPFGLLMTLDDAGVDDVGRITRFASFGHDEVADVQVNLTSGEAHTPFPADYRRKEAVERATAEGEALMKVPVADRPPVGRDVEDIMRGQYLDLQERLQEAGRSTE